ncbi:peptidoglycan-binding domain-containing protein [Luteipulveratus flavus]|uniref:Peptidoglycan-binding domain-containing protein n=1 Tax=Luteipulveratus flavus TaxID=3031728 RepID=A0ABT6CBX0_9MICO|nr:peptidoglycan-binding protein [Luteipulveratus sp. YIM 133296]MDF8265554.1 peptidoglycan-binding domain-containing protein [Luteipulveratus sp. YIM 133296]
MTAQLTRRAVLGGAVATAAGAGLLLGAPAASAAPNYSTGTFPTLSPGMTGLSVRALRYLLTHRGHHCGIANTYDTATTSAVRAFQSRRGLPATGTCNDATFRVLIGDLPATHYGETNYFVGGLQTLLIKHGYHMDGTTYFGSKTRRNVWAFQVGHNVGRSDYVSMLAWSSLFGPVSSGPMYPMLQRDTGTAQWSNCGPVAAIVLLIHQGKTPSGWTWDVTTRRTAVENFRYVAMGLAHTAARDAIGTEYPDFVNGFGKYGMSLWHGGIEDTLTQARAGRPSIAGGDVYKMPYAKSVSGPVSHWVTVLGFDGTYYLVADSISATTADYVHRLTATQLRTYAATNPGHPPETAKQNSILLR